MTKLPEQALQTARGLPPELQDEIAHMVFSVVGDPQPVVALTLEDETALEASEAAAARGEFATDDQIRAIREKHGL